MKQLFVEVFKGDSEKGKGNTVQGWKTFEIWDEMPQVKRGFCFPRIAFVESLQQLTI